MELIRITPNKERVKSISKMVILLEKRIKIQDKKTMAALITVDYYEVVKELITALLLLDGYKTLSHKDLILYLSHEFKDKFFLREIKILDELRILRNRVSYEGFSIEVNYLKRNEQYFKAIIQKLKDIIHKKCKV